MSTAVSYWHRLAQPGFAGLVARHGLVSRLLAYLAIVALAVALVLAFRPWQERWGATDEEAARPMPGDELVPSAAFNATRAVTVNGRPEDIWPWIVQMGVGRAGFYAYDLIDGYGRWPSAQRIVPELQHLAVGDTIRLSPLTTTPVRSIDPYRAMVWGGAANSWAWGLYPVDAGHTRLVTRMRSAPYDPTSPDSVALVASDAADIVMMRNLLLGIKQRVEGTPSTDTVEMAQVALWHVGLAVWLAALSLMLLRRAWWRPWAVAMAVVVVTVFVLYLDAPFWLLALLELGLVAGLAWAWRTSARPRPALAREARRSDAATPAAP
jgi:hypothetical protein